MEYLRGGELYDYWESKIDKRISENETKEIMLQLMHAVEYCHSSKIVHRDLKFQNIILTRKPFTDINKAEDDSKTPGSKFTNEFDIELKLVDFGIFGSTLGNSPEKSNAGSLKYMPPEVLKGYTETTPKIDVWALGIMLHAMIVGVFPFRSSNRDELKRQIIEKEITINRKDIPISDNCLDLINKMLDKDPLTRISMSEIFEHPWIAKYLKNKRKK